MICSDAFLSKNFVKIRSFPGNTLILIKLHFLVENPTCERFQPALLISLGAHKETNWPQRGTSLIAEAAITPRDNGSSAISPELPCPSWGLHTISL